MYDGASPHVQLLHTKKRKKPTGPATTHMTEKKTKENSWVRTSGLRKDERHEQRLQVDVAHGEPYGIGLGSA